MFGGRDKTEKNVRMKKMEELVLPNSRLKFCVDQLQNLNFIFNKRLERSEAPEHLSLGKQIRFFFESSEVSNFAVFNVRKKGHTRYFS